MRVRLEPWEYEYASFVGTRRFTANWGVADAEYYDPQRMEDDRTAQVAASIAELAVAKCLNLYWPGSVWHASAHRQNKARVADVGRRIEVRRVRVPTGHAAVRRHQVGQGLDLYVACPAPPEFRVVEILGWLPYDDAWNVGEQASYDRSGATRTVAPGLLKAPVWEEAD